jgi:hypothetical protein
MKVMDLQKYVILICESKNGVRDGNTGMEKNRWYPGRTQEKC